MKTIDVFDIGYKNLKRRKKKNIPLVIVFTVIIVVFNLAFSLINSLSESTVKNISNNNNLKIISVSTVEDEIENDLKNKIERLNHVDMVIYKFSPSVAIDDEGIEAEIIGMNNEEATYITGRKIELGKSGIIMNSEMKEKGYEVGQTIKISFNSQITNSSGIRKSKKLTIVGFYEQPTIENWYSNEFIVSNDVVYEIGASIYGVTVKELSSSNQTKQIVNVFVDKVENVSSIAKNIEKEGLITSYGLEYNQGLPMFAKAIIIISSLLIILLLFLAIIVMNTTLNTSIKSRYKEIGILKSVGFTSIDILKILSMEVLYLWFAIVILATLTSIILVKSIPYIIAIEVIGKLEISAISVGISAIFVLFIMFLTTASTIKKASKLKTIDVIRSA